MVEKATPFERKDEEGRVKLRGHIVSMGGTPRVFVELGKDFTFGRDEDGGLHDGYLRDNAPEKPPKREARTKNSHVKPKASNPESNIA